MAAADVPIRHIDDIEVPASGMWPAVGASSVVRSTWRHGASATPVVGGWLEVGDDPATNSLCIELDDSILLATTSSVSHDGHASEWHLEGFASRPNAAIRWRSRCGTTGCSGRTATPWRGGPARARSAHRTPAAAVAVADGRIAVIGSSSSCCSRPLAATARC